MAYLFSMPAVKGEQCGREYYIAVVPFGLLPRIFSYNEESVPAEIRMQRELNEKRIPEIASYILHNDDWLFSSLTASVDGNVKFIPLDNENPDVGLLEVDMSAAFYITDGQHLRAGIIEALKENPELARETISVVIYRFESNERANQMFADLNRYAQKPTKSLNVSYDSRDPLSQATNEMLHKIEIFNLFTDKDRVSLAAKSPKLFTLGSLYEANRHLLKMTKKRLETFSAADTEKIISYWTVVVKNMPLWEKVCQEELKPSELREEYICSHSVVIQAIGIMGSYLMVQEDWQEILQGLRAIDWRRNNPEWKGIVISANGRVVNSKPVAKLTAVLLRQKLGLSITSAEEKELKSI